MSGVLSTIPTIETSDGLITYVVLACLNGDTTIKVFDLIVATPIATVTVPKANPDAIAYARSVSDVMQSVTSSLSSSKRKARIVATARVRATSNHCFHRQCIEAACVCRRCSIKQPGTFLLGGRHV
jgi:hypothetical protein